MKKVAVLACLAALLFVANSAASRGGESDRPRGPRPAAGPPRLAQAQPAPVQKKTRQTKDRTASRNLVFPLDEGGIAYAGIIDEIDNQGLILTAPAPERGYFPPVTLTEGYYLALTSPAAPAGQSPPAGSHVLLAQVTRVGKGGRHQVQVAASAFDALDAEHFLFLIRPRESTTDEMKGIPELAELETEGGDAGGGLGAQNARTLVTAQNNLKQIGLALHNFHDTFRCFPPAVIYGPDGKPWHSWRVLILPYLEQLDLYNRYRWDEPWNGPNNSKLLSRVPPVYRDPVHGESDDAYTHFAAATGANACFPADGPRMQAASDQPQALLNSWPGRRGIQHIVDGTSNTVIVGSISPDCQIPWMKPEDVPVDEGLPALGKDGGFAAPYTSAKGNAGLFLFADGSVTTILDSIRGEALKALLTINDGQVLGDGDVPTLGPDRYARPTRPEIHIVREGGKARARWVLVPRHLDVPTAPAEAPREAAPPPLPERLP